MIENLYYIGFLVIYKTIRRAFQTNTLAINKVGVLEKDMEIIFFFVF